MLRGIGQRRTAGRQAHRRRKSIKVVTAPRLGAVAVLCALALIPIEYAVLSATPASAGTSPDVTAVRPDVGPLTGHTAVTITGNHFEQGSTTVTFGTETATDVTVTSPTTLTAVAPEHPGGSVDVNVTTASGGMSNPNPADLFAYGPPSTTGVSPGAGAPTGGTVVTVTGTSFAPGATVSFGATPARDVTILSATTLVATAPASHSTGDADVTVTTPGTDGGTSAATYADLFAYGAPTVTNVAPETLPAATASPASTTTTPPMVTITGTDFSLGDTVLFGLTPATDITVWGASVITAVPPPSVGGADVTVGNALGTSPASVGAQFAIGAPTVTGLSRSAGPPGGGETLAVTGTGFVAGTTVDFGSMAATGVTVVSPTVLHATVPPGGPGSVGVTVTTPQGTSAASAADLYAYGPPSVTSVSPRTAATEGGRTVTITGTGLVPGATVRFGTTEVPGADVNATGTSLRVPAPAAADGSVDVTVTTAAGQSATSVADLFATGAPVVTRVAVDAGPVAGGNDVIVAGNGFVPGLTVSFGDRPAALAIVTPGGTGLYTVAPAGSAGPVDVTVMTPQGRSATNRRDTYFYGGPVVTKVTHPSGSAAGDSGVKITGTGFSPDATVSFGMQPASAVTVHSPTSITAMAPPANPGVIGVRVDTGAGLSPVSPADHFAYGDRPASSAGSACNSIELLWVGLQGRWRAAGTTGSRATGRGDATLGWALSADHVTGPDRSSATCQGRDGPQLLSRVVDVGTRSAARVPARSAPRAPLRGAG